MTYQKLYINCVTINIHIFIILIVLTGALNGNYTCKYKPCGGTAHTMCEYPAELDKTKDSCNGPDVIGGLSSMQRQGLLDAHNNFRQSIARGLMGLPKAANMMKLRWSYELEDIAQRFLNSCPEAIAYDSCRNMLNGMSVGQNSVYAIRTDTEHLYNNTLSLLVVKLRLNEIYGSKQYYKGDKTISPAELSNYSQIVWATTEELGCGYITHVRKYLDNQYYTCNCNYAFSGSLGSPMYKVGEPCSQCPVNTRCSKVYPGLCTAEDELIFIPPRKENHTRSAAGGTLHPCLSISVFAVVFLTLFILNN